MLKLSHMSDSSAYVPYSLERRFTIGSDCNTAALNNPFASGALNNAESSASIPFINIGLKAYLESMKLLNSYHLSLLYLYHLLYNQHMTEPVSKRV